MQTWSTSKARCPALPLTTTHHSPLQTSRTSQCRASPSRLPPASSPTSPPSPSPSPPPASCSCQSDSCPDDDVPLGCSGPWRGLVVVLIDLMINVTLAALTFLLCPVTLSSVTVCHRKANGTKLIIADLCQPIHHWSFYLT